MNEEAKILNFKKKQEKLMSKYEIFEDMQSKFPWMYRSCQREMDKLDQKADSLRRKIYELVELRK